MKSKFLLFISIFGMSGCTYDQARLEQEFDSTIGDKFDVYQFVGMSHQECLNQREIRSIKAANHIHRGFQLYPWNRMNFENCGIHKVGETSKTADYEITYYGTCKYIYTIEKKTDIILGWRYTKDSKNCVPGP